MTMPTAGRATTPFEWTRPMVLRTCGPHVPSLYPGRDRCCRVDIQDKSQPCRPITQRSKRGSAVSATGRRSSSGACRIRFPRVDLERFEKAFLNHKTIELDANHFFFEDAAKQMIKEIGAFVSGDSAPHLHSAGSSTYE